MRSLLHLATAILAFQCEGIRAGDAWLEDSSFQMKASYGNVSAAEGVSGALPQGWQDNSSWSGAKVKYTFGEEQGAGYLKASCNGEGICQLSKPIARKLDGLQCFELSFKARSKDSSTVTVALKADDGSNAELVKRRFELQPEWKLFKAPVSGGPSDAKLRLCLEMFSPASAEMASIRFVSVPAASYVPEAAQPAARDDESWRERNAELMKCLAASSPDFVIMGDSLTQRWEQDGSEAWSKHIEPLKAGNFGIDGDSTQHLLWRISNSGIGRDFKPKLVAMLIGTNNLGAGEPIREIAIGAEACVKELKRLSPQTKILVLGVFPMGKDDKEELESIASLNKLYAAMADSKTVFFADFGALFLEKDGSISQETMPDYVHLSSAAYIKYAKALEQTARPLLAKQPPDAKQSHGKANHIGRDQDGA